MEKKYHTTGTFPKSKREIVERGKIDTHNIQIHDCSLSWINKKWRGKMSNYNYTLFQGSFKSSRLFGFSL
jgi:hypothetical protein